MCNVQFFKIPISKFATVETDRNVWNRVKKHKRQYPRIPQPDWIVYVTVSSSVPFQV